MGVTVKVLLSLDFEGLEDIWIQELKLSDETWNVPLQELFEVFVVIEEVSIDSENVTEMDVLIETEVSPLIGEVDETVGGVLSVEVVEELSVLVVGSWVYVLSFFPHETNIKNTRIMNPLSIFLLLFFCINESEKTLNTGFIGCNLIQNYISSKNLHLFRRPLCLPLV